MSIYISACEKDQNTFPKNQSEQITNRSASGVQPTQEEIVEAKQLFYSQINNLSTVSDSGPLLRIWNKILPIWEEGRIVNLNSKKFIFFPTINGITKSYLQLSYFKNDNGEKYLTIIGFWKDFPGQTNDNFNGSIFDITKNGYPSTIVKVESGKIVKYSTLEASINENDSSLEYRDDNSFSPCDFLKCPLRGRDCYCDYYEYKGTKTIKITHSEPIVFAHGPPPFTSEEELKVRGHWVTYFCNGTDCTSFGYDGIDEVDGDGSGVEDVVGNSSGGNNIEGGGGDSGGDLKNEITDIISILLDGVNPSYKPCNKEREFDGYQPFAAQTMDYDDYLNLPADAIFSMWGNNTGIALVNAILSSNGDLANALYNQVNPDNDFEYDENNPVHQAVLNAVQALIANINNANGDCNSIMSMDDFVELLKNTLNNELSNTLNENFDIDCDIKDLYDLDAKIALFNFVNNNTITDPCDPNKSSKTILENMLNDKCSKSPNNTPGTLKNLMNDIGDSGDEVVNNLEDERLKCIWEYLSENANDEIFCNTISNFFGETNVDLVFNEGNIGSSLALTTSYSNPDNAFYGWVSISFNKSEIDDYCEITLYETFLHEGIHAEMKRQNHPENENPNLKAAIWDKWDKSTDDHNNIANNYIPYIIETLKQRYGDRYTNLEYEAIAWSGLGNINNDPDWDEMDNTKAWKSLTDEKRKALQEAFKNVNSNCDEDECKKQ